MDDRARVMMSALLGGLLGGLCGFLYLTEEGRKVRDRIEPFFDEFGEEMRGLRQKVDKARQAAQEGVDSFHEITSQTGADRERWRGGAGPQMPH